MFCNLNIDIDQYYDIIYSLVSMILRSFYVSSERVDLKYVFDVAWTVESDGLIYIKIRK